MQPCSPREWLLQPYDCGVRELPLERLPKLLRHDEAPTAATAVCLIHWPQTDQEPLSGYDFSEATRVGTANMGNLVWMYAARSLLNPAIAHVGEATARARGLNGSALLMPQANILRPVESTASAVLAKSAAYARGMGDTVVRNNLPTLVLGIGSQALRGSDPRSLSLGPDHLRFLREAGQRGVISVRGQFTADLIDHNGGPPTVVAGCPSLFLNKAARLGRTLHEAYNSLPALAATRKLTFAVGLPSDPLASDRLCGTLLRLVADHPGSFVVVQDANDYTCLDTFGPKLKLSFRSVRFFYSVRGWARALGTVDAVVSARIHGSMIGLAARKPTVAIATDNRVWELAEAMGVPYLWQDAPAVRVARIDVASIFSKVASSFDGAAFDANRGRIAAMYRDMFARVGIPLHPAVLQMAAAREQGRNADGSEQPQPRTHPPHPHSTQAHARQAPSAGSTNQRRRPLD
jgi:hypothetical protein